MLWLTVLLALISVVEIKAELFFDKPQGLTHAEISMLEVNEESVYEELVPLDGATVKNIFIDTNRSLIFVTTSSVIYTFDLNGGNKTVFMGQANVTAYTTEGSGEEVTFNNLHAVAQLNKKYLIAHEENGPTEGNGSHIELIDIDGRNKTYFSGKLDAPKGSVDGHLTAATYDIITSFCIDVKSHFNVIFTQNGEKGLLRKFSLISKQVTTLADFPELGIQPDPGYISQHPVTGDLYISLLWDTGIIFFDYKEQQLIFNLTEPLPLSRYLSLLARESVFMSEFMFIGADYLVFVGGDYYALNVWDMSSQWSWREVCTPRVKGNVPGTMSSCKLQDVRRAAFFKGDLYVLDADSLNVFRDFLQVPPPTTTTVATTEMTTKTTTTPTSKATPKPGPTCPTIHEPEPCPELKCTCREYYVKRQIINVINASEKNQLSTSAFFMASVTMIHQMTCWVSW